jgi:putative ABC transport system ATP-binding protein
MNGPLIQLEALSKRFRAHDVETNALSEIHLSIAHGEYVSISGPSGCGKSTLLSILGLVERPTSGAYRLNGREVSGLPVRERARIRNQEIGFIFQSFNLIADLTVYENVELPLTYRRAMSSPERKRRVTRSLERVGLGQRTAYYPEQLSGGEQQRAAIARALAGSPSIILADEPTGNLDSVNGEAVMRLLQEIHQDGATICVVTHNCRFAAYAGRQIHLFDGMIGRGNKPLCFIALQESHYGHRAG